MSELYFIGQVAWSAIAVLFLGGGGFATYLIISAIYEGRG